MTESKRKLLSHGADRPLVCLVALDPAYTGPSGLAVIALPSIVIHDPTPVVWEGDARSQEAMRWLGEAVAAVTPRGTRAHLICELDGFGPSVARKLGITVGCVEGLLVDLNAIVPGTREDIASTTWRKALWGTRVARGRVAKKAQAVKHARARWGAVAEGLGPDGCEALCLLEVGTQRHASGELLG